MPPVLTEPDHLDAHLTRLREHVWALNRERCREIKVLTWIMIVQGLAIITLAITLCAW